MFVSRKTMRRRSNLSIHPPEEISRTTDAAHATRAARRARAMHRYDALNAIAVEKPYRFAWWPLEFELAPLIEEITTQQPEWLESQWKWHVESRFALLRTGQRASYPGSELTNGHSINQ